MRLLLALPILLLPNTLHFPPDVAVGASVALVLISMLVRESDPPALHRPAQLLPPLLALFFAMLIAFIAAHWHDLSDTATDLRDAKVAVLYPLLYLGYLRCGLDLRHTRQLIALVLAVAVGAGLEAVFQGMGFNLGQFSDSERATGPFGPARMANRAGVFFAMFLPMLVALAVQARQTRWVRWTAFAGALVLTTAILFTYSRQAYLIGLFTIMVVLVWRSIPAALLAVLMLAATATVILPTSVVERVQETQQVNASGTISFDVSTTSRFTVWNGTLDMLRDHPTGVGLNRFSDRISEYTNYSGKDAHNGFLLTLAECGPLGLLALLWVCWRLWRLTRWLRRSPGATRPGGRTLELGFTLAVVAMVLGNLYGSPFFEGLIMANFWILCGLMERYGTLKLHAAELVADHARPMARPLPLGLRFPLAGRALPGLSAPKELRH